MSCIARTAAGSKWSAAGLSLLFFYASTSAAQGQERVLKQVIVTATRQATDIDQVPATISTIGRAALDQRLPHDEAALFADEPDVVVGRDPRRYGATAVNIRGIDGIRVLQQVDGVRLPDYYNGSGPSNITAAIPHGAETEFLQRVEILRGPASSLYGSDALGGVVGYLTLDPADILQGRPSAGRYRATWRGADASLQNTFYGAFGQESTEGLLAITRRTGQELGNQGANDTRGYGRERPNPMDTELNGVLAKLVLKPGVGHRVAFTLEGQERDNRVETLRLEPSLPKMTASRGSEDNRRDRLGIQWEWKPTAQTWFTRLVLGAYRQDANTRTRTLQTRSDTGATCSASSGTGNTCLVDMDFRFKQQMEGASLQMESAQESHLLTYGIEWNRSRTDQMRDYWITNLTTGGQSKSLAGDTYPLRDFAPGKSETEGLFLQDEIYLADGRLKLMPGIRYDHIRLQPDAMSKTAGNIVLAATPQEHRALSPKFGAIWQMVPDIAWYGQAVRGFRAPNYEEVNGLFYNAAQNYVTLPNGELKPERSLGLEVGARLLAYGGEMKLAVFDNRYDDFIEQVRICTTSALAPASCPGNTRSAYQKVNLAKVRIRGIELRGTWPLGPGMTLHGALARANGRDEVRDQPLNSVEPTRLSFALAWNRGQWGGEARLRAAAAKGGVDRSSTDYYLPGGYTVADLGLWRVLGKGVRIHAGLNNLFDRAYLQWSDVRHAGLTEGAPGKAFYTQPGRNASLSLQVDF